MNKKVEVNKGDVYGRLTILKEVSPHIYPSGKTRRKFLVQCSCGSDPFEVMLDSLRSGRTTSCGCIQREKLKENNKKKHKTNTYDLETYGYGIGYTFKGEEFLFDLEDFDLIKDYCWCVDNHGYVVTKDTDTRKFIQMHRFLMDCPEDKVVDHINREKNNNRKENLRICSQSENCKNLSISKRNKTGMTGITWHKASSKWQARITTNGKRINLGVFNNLEDAKQARLEAELKYFGEFSINYNEIKT